jgi:hypothetical protein
LVSGGEDVGRLGHEVHAAEHDVVGGGVGRGKLGEAERVAPGVGPAHDLVALVVVAEDEDALAEGGLGGGDPPGELGGTGVEVAVGELRLHAQHFQCPPWGKGSD